MRQRAICDLCQLKDQQLFSEISQGIGHVSHSADRLVQEALTLAQSQSHIGSRLLLGMAEEEAAKVLILLDAVRSPRDLLPRHLKGFNQHLAKRIYAEVCNCRPCTFGEIATYTRTMREEFYLDGPNGVDWVFRNRVLGEREGNMYVDYAATDDGHCWMCPSEIGTFYIEETEVLRVARALAALFATPEALAKVAGVWRSVPMTIDFSWQALRDINSRTIQAVESLGLQPQNPGEVYGTVVNEWPFPMYSLDLAPIKTDPGILKKEQGNWSPDL